MTYKLFFSTKAKQDLLDIETSILGSTQSKETTAKLIKGILDSIEIKKFFPKTGKKLMSKDTFTGYYYAIYKKYLSFYRIDNNSIYVDRILYGGMDYMKVLFPELPKD